MAEIAYLEAWRSGNRVTASVPQTVDPETKESLYVRYDMEALKKTARRENPAKYAAASAASLGMWRYRDVLPSVEPVTLGGVDAYGAVEAMNKYELLACEKRAIKGAEARRSY